MLSMQENIALGPHKGASETMKELEKLGLGEDVQLKILERQVKYSEVETRIAKIWSELHPQLCVHVGMMSSSKAAILEQCGRNKGYTDRDICGAQPQEECCLQEGPDRITSVINMKNICRQISCPGIDVIYSRDAGRYLCEYAYYISLYYGNGRAVFIHVPQLSTTFTKETLGQALQMIIHKVLKQLASQPDSPDIRE